jgi:hypothetical protein
MVSRRSGKKSEKKSLAFKKQRIRAQKSNRPHRWRSKQTTDKGKPSTNIDMVFILPIEFKAPSRYEQEESDEAIFDKPSQHQHLKALYMKEFVNGRPVTEMLVDGGAAINLIPDTMFRKLGKGSEDLLETDIILKDFGGNASKTRGQLALN